MRDIVWVDLGEYSIFRKPRLFKTTKINTDLWHDHGLGLLRTIMHAHGVLTDVESTKNCRNSDELVGKIKNYRVVIMNVRSYDFYQAREIAEKFKQQNKCGKVVVGGMHTLVGLEEMQSVTAFDKICVGSGEASIVEIINNLHDDQRVVLGKPSKSMDEWPPIDRNLWPRPVNPKLPFPLEPAIPGWCPGPVASVLTSRVCPWRCSFCNEASYIKNIQRKSVEVLIDELNNLDNLHGPIGSVVIHDSMFFQNPQWLEEFLEKYPKMANKPWPYWAAARADTVRKWPDLFRELILKTNWNIVSIGLESGSDNTLLTLNKECTVQDNVMAIQIINEIGDLQEQLGVPPVRLFSNVMWGVPGESKQDVLDTIRMVSMIKRPLLAYSMYAPYPGGALGYQIIAEGRSLLSDSGFNRCAGSAKVKNIDFDFVKSAMKGAYNKEATQNFDAWLNDVIIKEQTKHAGVQHLYAFDMPDGRKKLSWGRDANHAMLILKLRLQDSEVSGLDCAKAQKIHQRELPNFVKQL